LESYQKKATLKNFAATKLASRLASSSATKNTGKASSKSATDWGGKLNLGGHRQPKVSLLFTPQLYGDTALILTENIYKHVTNL